MSSENGSRTVAAVLTTADLASLHEKLDRIIEFQEKLEPYLPLLARASSIFDNPAFRFRDVARLGRRRSDEHQG